MQFPRASFPDRSVKMKTEHMFNLSKKYIGYDDVEHGEQRTPIESLCTLAFPKMHDYQRSATRANPDNLFRRVGKIIFNCLKRSS